MLNKTKLIFFIVLSIQTTLVGASKIDEAIKKTNPDTGQLQKMREDEADKIMKVIGVKPGMVIGEVGAGGGRLTVHLARGIGNSGKIYANDINENVLAILQERCKNDDIKNIETILGRVDDPLFPKVTMDMVIMIKVYHALTQPVALLKNVIPALKPGAPVVIIDYGKNKGAPASVSTLREDLIKESGDAGFKLVWVLTSLLPEDDIYIFKVKTHQDNLNPLLTEMSGLYEMQIGEQNLIILFYLENGKLILGHENNPPSECKPVQGKELIFEVTPPTGPSYPVEFMRDEGGKIIKCVFRARDRDTEAIKR